MSRTLGNDHSSDRSMPAVTILAWVTVVVVLVLAVVNRPTPTVEFVKSCPPVCSQTGWSIVVPLGGIR